MTTEVVKSIGTGGDYTSISAWEAALPADLVSADERHIGEIINSFTEAANVDINGQITDADRNIILRNAESVAHGGVFGAGAVVSRTATYSVHLLVTTHYTVLDGISVNATGNGGTAISLQGTGVVCRDTLVRHNSGTTLTGISAGTGAGKFIDGRLLGCAVRMPDTTLNGIVTNHYVTGSGLIANCVTNGKFSKSGPTTQGGPTIKNCAADGFGTSLYRTGSDNNASYDTSATSVAGANSITGITDADFADVANGDFHLAAGSALIGAGTNLYSTFTTDIDGDERPSSGAWDIGFDHYVAASGTIIETTAASRSVARSACSAGKIASAAGAAATAQRAASTAGKIGAASADARIPPITTTTAGKFAHADASARTAPRTASIAARLAAGFSAATHHSVRSASSAAKTASTASTASTVQTGTVASAKIAASSADTILIPRALADAARLAAGWSAAGRGVARAASAASKRTSSTTEVALVARSAATAATLRAAGSAGRACLRYRAVSGPAPVGEAWIEALAGVSPIHRQLFGLSPIHRQVSGISRLRSGA